MSSPRSPSPRVAPDAQAAPLVHERDREPVDLRLADDVELLDLEEALHALVPRAQLGGVEDVAQREHRLAVLDRLERLGDGAANALRGRGGRDEFGVALLEVHDLAVERVELAVADLGGVEHVVAVLVVADARAQLLDPQAGRFEVSCVPSRHLAPGLRPRLSPLCTRSRRPARAPARSVPARLAKIARRERGCMADAVIIDYGAGNLRSVARAVAHAGYDAEIRSDPAAIEGARALILPGVGAAADTMANLRGGRPRRAAARVRPRPIDRSSASAWACRRYSRCPRRAASTSVSVCCPGASCASPTA